MPTLEATTVLASANSADATNSQENTASVPVNHAATAACVLDAIPINLAVRPTSAAPEAVPELLSLVDICRKFGYSKAMTTLVVLGDDNDIPPNTYPLHAEARDWIDYPAAFGVSADDIPALMELACDKELFFKAPAPLWWGIIHSWRALGQLGVVEAVTPLLQTMNAFGDEFSEWHIEELPDVFRLMGAKALPALADFLSDATNAQHARTTAADGMTAIANDHPATRERVIASINNALSGYTMNAPVFNACLVENLLVLKAVESANLIEDVYASGCMEESFCGPWGNVRRQLGVEGRGIAPEGYLNKPLIVEICERIVAAKISLADAEYEPARTKSAYKAAKVKRKQAAKARKRNRRR